MKLPIVQIHMVEGRDSRKISECVKAVARTVAETLDAPLETVRVFATQVSADCWAAGDRTKAEIDAKRNESK